MNFNIYLDDRTGQQLMMAAERTGETRNALIRQAVSEWLARSNQPTWRAYPITAEFEGRHVNQASEGQHFCPPAADPLT